MRPGRRDRYSSELCADRFDLGIRLQRLVAHFATPPRLLVAPEGKSGVEDVVTVDPYRSGPDLLGQGMGLRDVIGPDAGAEPVRTVVGHPGDVIEALERGRHHHGTEYLLADDLHVGPGVGQDRGFHEVAAGAAAATPREGRGPVGTAGIEVSRDPPELLVRDRRAARPG